MSKIRTRVATLVSRMADGIYEKEHIAAAALLCAVAGENIFLLGPPGTAKSLVARRLKEAFAGARTFEYLMSRFSTPDELFGPVSISRLKDHDRYERLTAGFLPDADVVFLDEIWKAGPSIQNTLLTAINEHIYYNGSTAMKIPMKVLIAASNELPPKDQGVEALWDRFLVRMVSNCIASDDNFELMLADGAAPAPMDDVALSADDYDRWQRSAREVTAGKEIFSAIKTMRHAVNKVARGEKDEINPDYYVSDRRWKKAFGLMKTSAYLNGRAAVDLSDLVLLIHCLWNTPACRREINRIVAEGLWTDLRRQLDDLDLQLQRLVSPARGDDADASATALDFVPESEYKTFYNSYYAVDNFEGVTALIPTWDYRKISYLDPSPAVVFTDHSLRMPVVQLETRNAAFALSTSSGRPRKVTLQKCNGGVMVDSVPYSIVRKGAAPATESRRASAPRAADLRKLTAALEKSARGWATFKKKLAAMMEENLFVSAADAAMVEAAMESVDRSIIELRVKAGNVERILS